MSTASTVFPSVRPDPEWPSEAVHAAAEYLDAAQGLEDRTYWPLLMHCSTNLFLWHLEAFASSEDPVPLFAGEFSKAANLLLQAKSSGVCGGHFTGTGADATRPAGAAEGTEFEDEVSGLFSDLWLGMSDEIYFEQPYQFTKERLTKSGVDPDSLFRGKVVVDAGCGGGEVLCRDRPFRRRQSHRRGPWPEGPRLRRAAGQAVCTR